MALIPPGGDHWIECEWRLFYPESLCPYSPAFTATYQAVLAVNLVALVTLPTVFVTRWRVLEKRV